MEFKLLLYDKELNKIDILQNIEKVIWTESWYEYGNITLEFMFSKKYNELFKLGYYIVKKDIGSNSPYLDFMKIENIQTSNSKITINGYTGKGMLRKRQALGDVLLIDVIKDLTNIVEINKRGLDIEILSPTFTETITDVMQYSFYVLGDLLNEVGLIHNFAWDLKLRENEAENTPLDLVFQIKRGIDRTDTSSVNYVGKFSDDIGNITNLTYHQDSRELYNYAIINRSDGKVGFIDQTQGLEKSEMYIDATSITKEYKALQFNGGVDQFGNPTYVEVDKIYNDAEFENAIMTYAQKEFNALSGISTIVSLDFESLNTNTLTYGKDFKIGDLLPISSKALGVDFNCIVADVTYTQDVLGFDLVYTLQEIR